MRSAGCWFNLKTLTRTVPPRRKDLPNAELIVLAVKRLETGLPVKIIPSVLQQGDARKISVSPYKSAVLRATRFIKRNLEIQWYYDDAI